jgi:ribosome maturation factor RimP
LKGLVAVGVGPSDAEALIAPVVEGSGLELVDVAFHGEGSGRPVLRVTVDRDGGVDLEAITEIAERISRRLDLEDFGRSRYELEVSSPGIERPLRSKGQLRRAMGTAVKVKTDEPVDGVQVHVGELVAVDDDAIVIEVDGAPRRISTSTIVSARTVADWAAELKGSAR